MTEITHLKPHHLAAIRCGHGSLNAPFAKLEMLTVELP
jgi:hypothetical protein